MGANASIVAIDTVTTSVRKTVQTGADVIRGLALSRDGRILGAATTSGGDDSSPGNNPGLYLLDASAVTVLARVPITGVPTTTGSECAFPRAFDGLSHVHRAAGGHDGYVLRSGYGSKPGFGQHDHDGRAEIAAGAGEAMALRKATRGDSSLPAR